jgi:hypothetical protein
MIETLDTGIVYRNPRPWLLARHAWHPSLVRLPSGELVASFDLAQAVEALDYATWLARSSDNGATWTAPQRLFLDPVAKRSTHSVRLGLATDGTLIGLGGRYYRDNAEEGLVNRANLGYTPMDLIMLTSVDGGVSWAGPNTINPPLIGPAFEVCHRVVELSDGRWLAPTSTWKGWNGDCPHGMQAVALVSHDRGETWPEYIPIIDQSRDGVISWEVGLAELADGRLVAIVWSFDERSGKSLPNRFAVAADGARFSEPRLAGLAGETAKLLALADGRLLCLYRRLDRPGLWAQVVEIDGSNWVNREAAPLWQGPPSGMSGARPSGDELSALKFGYPSAVQMPDGSVLVVFWCVEECLHVIRWQRLRVPM